MRRLNVWVAAFCKRAWVEHGHRPLRFVALLLTFDDGDFQRLVLYEEDRNVDMYSPMMRRSRHESLRRSSSQMAPVGE